MTIEGSLTKRKYLNVILPLFIASMLAYIDRLNISYAALTMNKDLGFSAQVFGMGAGILFFGYVVFEVPGTVFAEKRSPSKWVVRIMITWGIVTALMGFVQTELQFYIVRFLVGAAEASFYPVCYSAIVPRWFNAKERPKALSILLTSMLVSSIIGSPLAGMILGITAFGLRGWQMLFILEGTMAFVFGIILIFWLKDWPKDVNWLTAEEKKSLQEEYEKEIAAKNSIKKYTLWEALKDKTVLKLCFIYFMWVTGFWGFGFWLPTVLKSISGLSNSSVSWLIIIPMSAALIGFIINGNSTSKTGETKWHIALPLFIGAVGMALGTLVSNPVLSFIFTCVTAVGVYVGMGVWWTVPISFLSGPAAAGATGLINSVGNLGGWVGPYLVGFIKTSTGSYSAAYVYLAVSLIIAGITMLTLKEKAHVNMSCKQENDDLNKVEVE
ncbi:MFS transporter [Clostridium carboxidivorans P7]|uniref:Major facilitator superfamily MFS_1 n=1 Tax=Clostridium carboxidivorans P7 TaxID=536227 RepID=C6PVV4_9CLOT|nr:MFS transporter [Clostridium carboxidivorans]AKN30139.1 MFS transporter [Clostridium carboxidivorans P7]EET86651.1 major facilitator superfamily MFS_1 [Clostridium carboxidivorans P7]